MTPAPGATEGDREDAGARAVSRLEEQRALLHERITRMDDDMAALVAASADSNADDEHDPEGQTIAFERSQLAALTDRTRERLAELDLATARLAAGTYGTCEVCGEPIDPARLEARPTATTCVRHAPGARHR
jgi:DnaK suppressor protein